MTILVAVDGVDDAEPILRTAVTLATGLAEELYVVHVVEKERADASAEQIRAELTRRLDDEAVETTVALEYVGRRGAREGPRVAHDLLEIAEDVDITHVVMGHEPKGIGSRLRSGDVAFAVIDETTVPVTVVPRDSQ